MQYETHRIELIDGTLVDRHEIANPEHVVLPPVDMESLAAPTPANSLDEHGLETQTNLNITPFLKYKLRYRKWIVMDRGPHPHGEEFVHWEAGYYIDYFWDTWVPKEAYSQFVSAFNHAMEISEIG